MSIKKTLALLVLCIMVVFTVTACGESPLDVLKQGTKDCVNSLKTGGGLAGADLEAFLGMESSDSVLGEKTIEAELDMGGDNGKIKMKQSSLTNEDKGEAALELTVSAQGEEMVSGAYFTGSDVIIKSADAEKPMIKYTMPEEAAAALKGQEPVEKLRLALLQEPQKYDGSGWEGGIDSAIESFAAEKTDDDVKVAEEKKITLRGKEVTAEYFSMSVEGSNAAETMKAMAEAMNSSAAANDLMTSADNLGSETGVNSLENLIKTIDAGNAKEMSLMIGVIRYEETVIGMDLEFKAPEGVMTINTVNWQNDKERDIRTSVRYFDNRGFDTAEVIAAGDGDKYNETNTQKIFTAGEKSASTNDMTATNTYGDGKFSKEFKTDFWDSGSVSDGEDMSGTITGTYEGTEKDGTTEGSFSGSIKVKGSDGGDVAYTGTSKISKDAPSITIPEFVAGSGKKVSSVADLHKAMGSNADKFASYNYAKQTMQAMMLMFMGQSM